MKTLLALTAALAFAGSANAITVKLGGHRFGHARAPEAVVARAAADQVGWDISDSFTDGPQTFNVAADGSVWLQDSFKSRLLVWAPGEPDAPPRTVPLPGFAAAGDVAFARDGSIYASAPGLLGYDPLIFHLSPAGDVLWSTKLPGVLRAVGQLALRIGPDGVPSIAVGGEQASSFGHRSGYGWLPVASPAGTPLTVAAQRHGLVWGYEPLAGGRRLVARVKSTHEVRYTLLNRSGRVVRSWRITSKTPISPGAPPFFTPELVHGDLVVDLDVARPGKIEHVILRLGPHGARARFSVPYSVFGDELYPDLRIGPDGKLYSLSTSPTNGVAINRYALK